MELPDMFPLQIIYIMQVSLLISVCSVCEDLVSGNNTSTLSSQYRSHGECVYRRFTSREETRPVLVSHQGFRAEEEEEEEEVCWMGTRVGAWWQEPGTLGALVVSSRSRYRRYSSRGDTEKGTEAVNDVWMISIKQVGNMVKMSSRKTWLSN